MAVYERAYNTFSGERTPNRTRFLVIPRYAYREIFRSRAFVAFFVAGFVWPVMLILMTYMTHNLAFLERVAAMTGTVQEPGTLFGMTFNGAFFMGAFLAPQTWMAFFITFIVAPALISSDLANNGLPLYLCRPFTKASYILGKLSVLWILLSAVTWVPGLLLWGLKAYLSGGDWWRTHLRSATGVFVGSWAVILVLSLVGLSLSAYVRWKPLARLGLFGVFVIGFGLGNILNLTLKTEWGSVVDIFKIIAVIWGGLLGVRVPLELSLPAAWAALVGICGAALWLLVRRVQAYEVVS